MVMMMVVMMMMIITWSRTTLTFSPGLLFSDRTPLTQVIEFNVQPLAQAAGGAASLTAVTAPLPQWPSRRRQGESTRSPACGHCLYWTIGTAYMATSTKLRSLQYSRRRWSSTVIAVQDIALGCAGLTERQGWGNAKDGQIFLSESWLRWGEGCTFLVNGKISWKNSVWEWQVTFNSIEAI